MRSSFSSIQSSLMLAVVFTSSQAGGAETTGSPPRPETRQSYALQLSDPSTPTAPNSGLKEGSLLIVGGGPLTPQIVNRFVSLAGGPEEEVVVIPTAAEDDELKSMNAISKQIFDVFGLQKITILHTRDRAEADTEAFVAPLKNAKGVWFGGGRHWRLVDSYLGTRTQAAIQGVLDRGGVVGGSSAGATIMGSFLVRGAREGNHIMVAKDYQAGLGYLKGVAIDQHLLTRDREDDLVDVIAERPTILGLGIDETTAIVVHGDEFEVIGRSVVGIYDGKDHDGKSYYFLAPGEHFDLKTRRRVKGPKSPQQIKAALTHARS